MYVNTVQWCTHAWTNDSYRNETIHLQIRRKQEWWILECNKKLRTIVFGNWNKTRTNSFLKMGKSSSDVMNVFKGSSLTGHRDRVYLESRAEIYYILQYFLIHCVYSKILNGNNEFCCLHEIIYNFTKTHSEVSENTHSVVSIFSYLDHRVFQWPWSSTSVML